MGKETTGDTGPEEADALRARVKELERELEFLTIVRDHSKDMIFISDYEDDFRFTFVSPSVLELGYVPEDLVGKPGTEFVHPEDLPGMLEVFEEIMANKETQEEARSLDFRMVDVNGQYVPVEAAATLIKSTYEMKGSIVFVLRDISEKITIYKALEDSESKYRSLIEDSAYGYFQMDLEGHISYANPVAAMIADMTEEEIIGFDFKKLAHPEDLERVFEDFMMVASGEPNDGPRRYRTISPKGNLRHVEINTVAIYEDDQIIGFQGTVMDITEAIELQQAIEEKEKNYRSLFEDSPEPIAIIDFEGNILDCNKQTTILMGYSKEEMIGLNFRKLANIPKEMLEQYLPMLKEIGAGHELPAIEVCVELEKSGERWLEVHLSLIEKDGEPEAIQVITHDITENKKSDEALKESERKYKLLFNSGTDAIFVHGFEDDGMPGKFIEVNDVACETYGWTKDEFMDLAPDDLRATSDPHNHPDDWKVIFDDKYAIFERIHVSKGGKEMPVEISSHLFELNNRKVAISMARNISLRKQNEREIKISSRRFKRLADLSSLRAEIWKLASDKSLGEDELIKRLLETIGPTLGVSRACFNRLNGTVYTDEIEWSGSGISPSIGANMPVEFVDIFIGDGIRHMTIDEAVESLPDEIKEMGTPLFKAMAEELHLESILGVALDIEGKREGCITLDICSDMDVKPEWNPESMAIVEDVVQIISQSLTQKRMEKQLKRSKEDLESRVKDRTKELRQTNIQLQDEIGQRRMVDEALKESEQKLQGILSSLHETAIVLLNKDGDIILMWADDKLNDRYGMDLTDLEGSNYMDLLPVDTVDESRQMIKDLFTKHTSMRVETVFTAPNGLFWHDITFSPLIGETKKVEGIVGFIRDITSLKEADDALQSEKDRLSITLRSIEDGVITTATDGKIVLMNKAAERLTGWKQGEALGQPFHEVVELTDRLDSMRGKDLLDQVVEKQRPYSTPYDWVLISKAGAQRTISVSGTPILDLENNVTGVVIVISDITDRKKLEEEARKVQKLESIGLLAGGIAHDFNNILTSVLGNISRAKLRSDADSEVHEILREAEKASLRATNLTQQLLTFSKGGAPIKKVSSIDAIIHDSADFALSGSNVRCQYDFDEDLWPVVCDEGQISQVIHNLIINADQAMPDGGHVDIKAHNLDLTDDIPPGISQGAYVEIILSDTGMGIPEDHLSKVFDPYFTTKQKGSGLGLATTFSIIKRHDGYIGVDSKVGKGTSFRILLPAKPDAPRPKQEEGATLEKGHGKILFMDDDELICEMAAELLEDLGYEVVFAGDGEHVIELYEKELDGDSPFDVVIMDLTVPGKMGGKEAIQGLLLIDKDVKAIVSSGYSNDPVMANYRKFGFQGVVAKPYRIEELSEALVRIMKH